MSLERHSSQHSFLASLWIEAASPGCLLVLGDPLLGYWLPSPSLTLADGDCRCLVNWGQCHQLTTLAPAIVQEKLYMFIYPSAGGHLELWEYILNTDLTYSYIIIGCKIGGAVLSCGFWHGPGSPLIVLL